MLVLATVHMPLLGLDLLAVRRVVLVEMPEQTEQALHLSVRHKDLVEATTQHPEAAVVVEVVQVRQVEIQTARKDQMAALDCQVL